MIRSASAVLSFSLLMLLGCSSSDDAGSGGAGFPGSPTAGASTGGAPSGVGGAGAGAAPVGGAGAPAGAGASAGGTTGGAGAPAGGGAAGAGTAGAGTAGAGTAGGPSTEPGKRVIGYVPNWYGSYASWVAKIDFAKVTHLNLAFALGDANGNLQLASNADIDTLVTAAHAKGVKVFPSLCGGGGDDKIAPFYEPNLVDGFVDKIIKFTTDRKFDGIDVDVEAPQRMGAKYDTFIAKLKAKATPLGLPVTAAVAQWMQSGMSDATLRSFDFINIMSYDATGTWTDAGEHSSYQQALDDLDYYEKKGVSKDKLVLGAPMYGYCWGPGCGTANNKAYVLYKDILAKHPDAASKDWIDSNGTKYSYNGTATMAKKTTLAAKYGGIMLWELQGDVVSTNTNSLLAAIAKAPR